MCSVLVLPPTAPTRQFKAPGMPRVSPGVGTHSLSAVPGVGPGSGLTRGPVCPGSTLTVSPGGFPTPPRTGASVMSTLRKWLDTPRSGAEIVWPKRPPIPLIKLQDLEGLVYRWHKSAPQIQKDTPTPRGDRDPSSSVNTFNNMSNSSHTFA